MLNNLIQRFWPERRAGHATEARRLYEAIVAQARQPGFYAELGVPDTVEGRFEMITLHAALMFRRLRRNDAQKALAQQVFDTFFADMDGSLREMGVGDIVVPKRIAAMGEAFYGRAQAYGAGLDADGSDALAGALARNLLGQEVPDADGRARALALAAYVREVEARLASMADAALVDGLPDWPQLPEAPVVAASGTPAGSGR